MNKKNSEKIKFSKFFLKTHQKVIPQDKICSNLGSSLFKTPFRNKQAFIDQAFLLAKSIIECHVQTFVLYAWQPESVIQLSPPHCFDNNIATASHNLTNIYSHMHIYNHFFNYIYSAPFHGNLAIILLIYVWLQLQPYGFNYAYVFIFAFGFK